MLAAEVGGVPILRCREHVNHTVRSLRYISQHFHLVASGSSRDDVLLQTCIYHVVSR